MINLYPQILRLLAPLAASRLLPTWLQPLARCYALIALCVLAGCSSEPSTLVLGSTWADPNKQVGRAIAETLQSSGVTITLNADFETAEEVMAAVESGAVDFALLDEPLTHNSNLNMLMPVLPGVLHVLHETSMGKPTLHELLSARSIYAGQPATQGRALVAALARHHQIRDLSARLLDNPWVPAPGKPPQVYFIFGGLLTPEARLGFGNYKIFSFDAASGSSPEALELLYPNLRPFTLPNGIYPELFDGPISTVAVETLLIARPDFSAETAYRIVQALYEESQPIERAYALSRQSFARPMANTTHTLTIHEGSRRFVEKDEPSLLERYAEVFALLVALALALGTGLTTWARTSQQRRKDRLDEYFLKLQSLRINLHERDELPAALRQSAASASADVAALETEVLQLLVEERLTVDSALVSFFLMSESVRSQLETTAKVQQSSS